MSDRLQTRRFIDQICNQFEAEWSATNRPEFRSWMERIEPQHRGELRQNLLELDLELRAKAGQSAKAEDYQALGTEVVAIVAELLERDSFADDDAHQASHSTTYQDPLAGNASKQIGPYKLLQKIGEGGMGTVWMAEQSAPIRRRVALKVIKAGLDSRQVVARFEAERQALALMDHPNIARFLDVGTTELGQPYFVMELVQGVPITNYCDQQKLSINERLALFVPVCQAVQHAHQKGIIHRDLKPTNVLISLYDGKPVPKVIDFGLAKALQHQSKLTDKTLFTEFGQVVGTLQYMSPEQAEMNQLDIDTRTDIYSLGVMLYELLTGSTPIDKETLKNEAVLKVLETIREIDPPRPSARLSSSTIEAVAGISAQRRIEPTKLKDILRGELDWVVMKALEKDRTRRYETANGLVVEIERFLAGEPVQARPPSASYRFRKYIKRHKGWVASLATIAVLLIVGTIASSWFGIQANLAKRDAINKGLIADDKSKEAAAEAKNARLAEKAALKERDQTEATLARSNYFLANARWKENRVAEAMAVLQSIPVKHRHFEWYLDRSLYEGSDVTLYGHQAQVFSVAFNSDGTQMASGSYDRTIKIWDTQTGAEIRTLRARNGSVYSLAFSPNGEILAAGFAKDAERLGDNSVILWDVQSGEVIRTLTDNQQAVVSLTFSPDGTRLVAGSSDRKISLWDSKTGAPIHTLTGQPGKVLSVVFCPKGTRLASVAEGANEIVIWDLQTGAQIRKLIHDQVPTRVAFSPDGSRLASVSSENSIEIWDMDSGRLLHTLRQERPVRRIVFSPDGTRLASAGIGSMSLPIDGSIKLWDVQTGLEITTLRGHLDTVNCLTFSPDGTRLASGSDDKTTKLWDVASGARVCSLRNSDIVHSFVLSADGTRMICRGNFGLTLWDVPSRSLVSRLPEEARGVPNPEGTRVASAARDHSVSIYDIQTGSVTRSLKGHENFVSSIAFAQDGTKVASRSRDGTIKLWDAQSGEEILSIKANPSVVNHIVFSPDGMQLASSNGVEPIEIWDVKSGAEIRTLVAHPGFVGCIAFSPDGRRLAAASQFQPVIKLWDPQTGEEVCTMHGDTSRITCLAFSPDNSRLISGSHDGSIEVWDAETGAEIRALKAYQESVTAVTFDPIGNLFTSGFDHSIKIWEAPLTSEMQMLAGHHDSVSAVALYPDGRRLVTGSADSTIKLWDTKTGLEIRTLRGHHDGINQVVLSPDGTKLASASDDKSVMLWDLESGAVIHSLLGHSARVKCVCFSEDGTRLASGSWDKTAKIWDLQTGEEICSLTGHPESVRRVVFSPDGTRLATASDATIKLWDVQSGMELRTMIGHEAVITSLVFSQDGNRICSEDALENRFVWNAETGEFMPHEEWPGVNTRAVQSPDGRWLALIFGMTVGLVDLHFKNTPNERSFREFKARPQPLWHWQQAGIAQNASNLYAAMFHYAWRLKSDNSRQPGSFDALHNAYKKWLESQDGKLPANFDPSSITAADLNPNLPPIIRDALLIRRPARSQRRMMRERSSLLNEIPN